MANKMSSEEVLKIAKLVELSLTSEEIKKLSVMLPETLDYVKVLDELDTKNIDETYQVTGLKNVFMPKGKNVTTLNQEEALGNAKEAIQDKFSTEAVFDR